MFNADQINFQIKKTAKELGFADVNRVRIILTLERVIARIVNNPFLKERLIFGGGYRFKILSKIGTISTGLEIKNLKKEIYV